MLGTPTATMTVRSEEFGQGRTPNPAEFVEQMTKMRLLPTPTVWVQGEVDLDKYLARRAREKAKGRNGNGFGIPLDMAVRLLPTPTSRDRVQDAPNRQGGASLGQTVRLLPTPTAQAAKHGSTPDVHANGYGSNLWDVPHLLPTPTTQDAKNNAGPSQWNRNTDPLNVVAAKLNGESSPKRYDAGS